MSNIVPINENEERESEAGLWISKINRGLSEQEAEQFGLWLTESQQNHDVFMSLAQL